MSKGLGQLAFLRRNYCVLKREREYACDVIEKELKALEFIDKRFGSFILTLIEDDLRTSKEERDLLKEVLL